MKNFDKFKKSVFAKKVIGPIKINYLPFGEYKDKYALFPKTDATKEDGSFYPGKIGYEKVDDWSYENEYRFILRYPNFQEIFGSLKD